MKRPLRLILVGAGHAHARVLLECASRRPAGVELVLVSPGLAAPYSGMMPGWLAGHYDWAECCVDFKNLSRRAGASVLLRRAVGLDAARAKLLLDDGTQLDYDLLSLDIGSTLQPPARDACLVLPMRPLDALQARWNHLLDVIARHPSHTEYRVLMIGGGAAGVESILAAAHRLRTLAPRTPLHFALATQGDDIVPGLSAGAARRLRAHLAHARVALITGFEAGSVEGRTVQGEDGRSLQADAVLWATGAQPWEWLAKSGLACDRRGFVSIDPTLRSVSHPNIFASGDCSGWESPLPKAGVYAVRMGPVLAHNLRAAVYGRALKPYQPQRRFMVLVGTGGAHAVGSWGPISWEGGWVWRWKQRIDRRFVERHAGC